jgi:D-alanyl-D-alanine carboxypeptidase
VAVGRTRLRKQVLGISLVVVWTALAGAYAWGEPLLQAEARRLVGPDQGVYARAEDGTVLAAVAADRAVHPASVSKVATTLALLRHLGPDHRFETRIAAGGPIEAGTLGGDLLVEAEGDPFLVYESAFLMLDALASQGVRRVSGRVVTEGPLLFNWKPDPMGHALEETLAGRDGGGAWEHARQLGDGIGADSLAHEALRFGLQGGGRRSPGAAPLVVYRSPSLRAIAKALNCYSNNVFHLLSDRIGGPAEVQRIARASVPVEEREEIILTNGAGAGTTNRLSPRATVELLDVLAGELRTHHLDLVDVLPVSGIDPGTLRERLDGPGERGVVVGKTGTYGSLGASALAGVVSTERFGRVTFAVLNHGVDVPEARRRQDAFVRALIAAGGSRRLDYHGPMPSPLTEVEVRQARAAASR